MEKYLVLEGKLESKNGGKGFHLVAGNLNLNGRMQDVNRIYNQFIEDLEDITRREFPGEKFGFEIYVKISER
jgi:hypothetical protein